MAAVFSRLPMRVRCATQRDHVFHPEMNYSQTQLDQLDRLTERWVADHLQKGKTSKKDKELVTLEHFYMFSEIGVDADVRIVARDTAGEFRTGPLRQPCEALATARKPLHTKIRPCSGTGLRQWQNLKGRRNPQL